MDTEELTIPHPGIEYREFVLIPLFEITGYNYKVPKYGKISKLIKKGFNDKKRSILQSREL